MTRRCKKETRKKSVFDSIKKQLGEGQGQELAMRKLKTKCEAAKSQSPMLPPAIDEINRLLPNLTDLNTRTMEHVSDGADLMTDDAVAIKVSFMHAAVTTFQEVSMAMVMAKSILDGLKKAEKQKQKAVVTPTTAEQA